jgi:hypothetical protein
MKSEAERVYRGRLTNGKKEGIAKYQEVDDTEDEGEGSSRRGRPLQRGL